MLKPSLGGFPYQKGVTLSLWFVWIGENDPVLHSFLSKDYASLRIMRAFLIKKDSE